MANEDQGNVALPKLYGAPAYARPPRVAVAQTDRPFDPDELPIEAQRTEEDRELAAELASQPWSGATSGEGGSSGREGSPMLRGRPFGLGSFTRRIRGRKSTTGR